MKKWTIVVKMVVDAESQADALEVLYKSNPTEMMKTGDVRMAEGDKWAVKLEGGEDVIRPKS